MIEIAEGFAQDLYQEGDLYAERDNRIQLPRMKRPAGIGEIGVAKRRAVKAAEAESEAPLDTLSTHSSPRTAAKTTMTETLMRLG